ncbi:MAG TPA: hypothetical protein VH761_16055 [Ilumatobacteraceae bacterium]
MRASGLQPGDPSGEVIELLDDDMDAFGYRGPTPVADGGSPRWVPPVIGLVLTGMIVYVVVSSVSSPHRPDAAPSTTAVETTALTPATTVAPLATAPYVAAEPPVGYALMGAEDSPATTQELGGDYGYQLWVAASSSAPFDSWFSIRSWGGGGTVFSAQDAYRVDVDGRSIAIGHRPGGVTTADFSLDNKLGVTLTSGSLSDGNVVRVASSVVDDGTHALLSYPALLDGFRRISTTPPLLAIRRSPTVHAYYARSDDPRDNFSIDVAPLDFDPSGGLGAAADRIVALRYGLTRTMLFTVSGYAAIAGAMADQPDVTVATWLTDDAVVTLTAMMPISRLVAIARTVHEVPGDTWQVMKQQARANLADANREYPFQEQPSQAVSFGTDANGTRWTVRVANATFGTEPQLAWHWSGLNATTEPSNTAQIHTFLDHDQTFVVADAPREITPTATLRVTLAGGDPVDIPFQDLGPEYDRTFAAYAFSEAGPYTAEALSADGRILASWSALL